VNEERTEIKRNNERTDEINGELKKRHRQTELMNERDKISSNEATS